MSVRVNGLNKHFLLVFVASLLCRPCIRAEEADANGLLNALQSKDRTSESVMYKSSFVLVRPAKLFDPNQGMVVMNCEVTESAGTFAMKIVSDYEKAVPVFVPRGSKRYQAGDYDESGNLIVWRPVEKYILWGPKNNDALETIKAYFVASDGTLVREGPPHKVLHRFPVGSRDNTYEYNEFQLATGRGFSKHLARVTSVTTRDGMLLKATGTGSFGSGIPEGIWELSIDPNASHLVREASFRKAGADEPLVTVNTIGIVSKDELALAKNGTLRYSTAWEVVVEVVDVSEVAEPDELYEAVVSRVTGSLPPGSDIMDFRGPEPTVTPVD